MTDARNTPQLPSKLRVLLSSIGDFLIDLLLPTVIYAALAPTDLPPTIRLTIGGFFLAGKACAGRLIGTSRSTQQTGPGRALVVGALIAALCSAITIVLYERGTGQIPAILAGTGVLVIGTLVSVLRGGRRLDGFAVLVLVELGATIALTSISDDPRFVLVRPSFYTAIAGLYVLTTVWSTRPFMMEVSRPMAAGGDPVRAAAFDRAGRESSVFRRAEQGMTFWLAVVLIAEAVLRVVTVLALPAGDVLGSSLWSQLPSIALIVVYLAVMRFVFVPRASREVDALMRTS